MKKLAALFPFIFALACQNPAPTLKQSVPEAPAKPTHHPVVDFVISFKQQHPNWDQNQVIHDQVNKIFQDSVLAMFKRPNIFSDYELKCTSVGTYNEDGKSRYFATFESENDSSITNSKIYLQLLAKISDSTMSKLAENHYYRVKKYSYLKRADNISIGHETYSFGTSYSLGAAEIKINEINEW